MLIVHGLDHPLARTIQSRIINKCKIPIFHSECAKLQRKFDEGTYFVNLNLPFPFNTTIIWFANECGATRKKYMLNLKDEKPQIYEVNQLWSDLKLVVTNVNKVKHSKYF